MKLTRGLVVGSMLGMTAAMMMNNQNKRSNTSYGADINQQYGTSSNYNNQSTHQNLNNHSYNYSTQNGSQSMYNYNNKNTSGTSGSDLIIDDKKGNDIIITDIIK